MPSLGAWKYANSPNYDVNVDKIYHYSEVPYLGDYKLVKIPLKLNTLIEHIDYWGEGRISVVGGCSGFADCYNINHVYQLVSKGPDINRKIPNRIPVISYTNCDTSSYIRDDSVKLITLMSAAINDSCAKDIGRIINREEGKVVVFGFDEISADIQNLERELKMKSLYFCHDYKLPNKLLGLTSFDTYRAYVSLNEMSSNLYKNVVDGKYDNAVALSKFLHKNDDGTHLVDAITKLLEGGHRNIISYAHQLWKLNEKDIISKYFPLSIQAIFKQDYVVIINHYYNLALKLDANTDSYNDRLAWGDAADKRSKRVMWKIIPIWNNNSVTFKIYNIEHEMFLKLDSNTNDTGNRKVWGAKNFEEERFEWILEPVMINKDLVYLIINTTYNMKLKLDAHTDMYDDRLLWGHKDPVSTNPDYFGWYIKEHSPTM